MTTRRWRTQLLQHHRFGHGCSGSSLAGVTSIMSASSASGSSVRIGAVFLDRECRRVNTMQLFYQVDRQTSRTQGFDNILIGRIGRPLSAAVVVVTVPLCVILAGIILARIAPKVRNSFTASTL